MKNFSWKENIPVVALVLLAVPFFWSSSAKAYPPQQAEASATDVIETAAIYEAVDAEFLSHPQNTPTAVTQRQLYQRRQTGQQAQYVVELTYRAAGDSSPQHSQYLVTQQPGGGYRAKWMPCASYLSE